MSDATKALIAELEGKMAEDRAAIAAIDARIAPIDAEIDALLAEEQALKARIDAAVAKLGPARGMPADQYLELKRRFGLRASTRMQLIGNLKAGL